MCADRYARLVIVRRFELRLLAGILAGLWAATCIILLGWYRPGGPLDLALGLAAVVPAGIAAMAVAWPPPAGDGRVIPGAGWLGLLTALVLAPLVAGVAGTAAGHQPQAIVPSPEIAYAWLVALAGTGLFAAVGIVYRTGGAGLDRARRLAAVGVLGAVLAATSAGLLAGAALANAGGIAAEPAAASRFGPTDPAAGPPACDGALRVGSTATLSARLSGEADHASLGEAVIAGERSGDDIAWNADVATSAAAGPAGAAVVGPRGWWREPGTDWAAVPSQRLAGEHLDATVLAAALVPDRLMAAEDRGLVRVDGAPARHCRVAIDGEIFRAAFPQVRWFAGDRSLHRWRGEIDYYVFGDGQLGLFEAWVNGEAEPVTAGAIQATIRASLSATDRGLPVTVRPLSVRPPVGG